MRPADFHVLFVFLDGVGLGPAENGNPFATLPLPTFQRLAGEQPWTNQATWHREADHCFIPLDANLDVPGLPQSGTGQASLFSGKNCAAEAGRHFGPYPHSTSKPILAQHNVFLQTQRLGLPFAQPASFLNAYPPRFFELVKARDRWTVTTRCCLDAKVPIRNHEDVAAGHALTADLTGQGWRAFYEDFSPITEAQAGQRMQTLSQHHAFSLFEYFLTDKVGHAQDWQKSSTILQSLDRFLAGLLAHFDPQKDLLLLTSDHGNLENLDVKTHTRNPVPLVAYGRGAAHFHTCTRLTDVTPAVIKTLSTIYEH